MHPRGRITSLLTSRASDCIEKLKSKAQDAPSPTPPERCDQINDLAATTSVEQELQDAPAAQEDELTQEMDVDGPATGSDVLTHGSTVAAVAEAALTTASVQGAGQMAGTPSAVSMASSTSGMKMVDPCYSVYEIC